MSQRAMRRAAVRWRRALDRRGLLLAIWAFPVLWGLLTSFKTERDVLAWPPVVFFEPTLANYREVLSGGFERSCPTCGRA